MQILLTIFSLNSVNLCYGFAAIGSSTASTKNTTKDKDKDNRLVHAQQLMWSMLSEVKQYMV